MRLLTHNFLACLQCETFPLTLSASELEVLPVAFDAEFTRRMLARMDYAFLVAAFRALKEHHEDVLVEGGGELYSKGDDLPESLDGADLSDESPLLRLLHFAMNQIAVKNGEVTCSACGQVYGIHEFIPNFVIEGKK